MEQKNRLAEHGFLDYYAEFCISKLNIKSKWNKIRYS